MTKIALEICAYSIESAITAQLGGADRIELCDNQREGGTTPSYGTICSATQKLTISLHVIIRPRGGDFLYSETEFAVMKKDIEVCKSIGVSGVVLGILQADGCVDKPRCRELVRLARPMSVTFHRAFDMAVEPFQALEDIVETGCTRVLTSGQAESAIEGADLIAKLVRQADGRIVVMPGVAINENNLAELISRTGAIEFHSSARKTVSSGMLFRKTNISMRSTEPGNEYELIVADQERIAKMRQIADQLAGNSVSLSAP